LRQRIVTLSQQHYNFMLIGTFELLAAKRDEIESYRGHVDAVAEYWRLRSELERAVGGPLEVSRTAVQPTEAPQSKPTETNPTQLHHGDN
jgi:cobalt-zinc-cadmium efflux system outer membrane protein